MNIYLEDRKKDISTFKKAITLCKGDLKTVEILKQYLTRIKEEYIYADFLTEKFMPLIQSKDNFYRAFIFCKESGDYNIEVYIYNADENSKNDYMNIYNKFCNENEDSFFGFKIYDIKKDKTIYDEAIDYDKIIIKPNKRKK